MTLLGSRKDKEPDRAMRQIALFGAVPGLLLVGPLIGYFIGNWADSKFDTAPYLMTLGIFLGLGAAGVEIYQLVKKASDMEKEDDR